MRHRGFTLIETLVGVVIFMGLVFVAFFLFEYGVRASFKLTNSQDLQSVATRIALSLQNELRRSARSSVTCVTNLTTPNNLRRDGVCFLAVSDWKSAAAFNSTYGMPNFDRYVNYYATTEEPTGRLIRSLYTTTPDYTCPPMASFSLSANCRANPAFNTGVNASVQLGDDIRVFRVTELGDGRLLASIELFRAGLKGPSDGTKQHDQSYQLDVEVFPFNTWPKE